MSPKLLSQQLRKRYYTCLGTCVIKSPLSPLFLAVQGQEYKHEFALIIFLVIIKQLKGHSPSFIYFILSMLVLAEVSKLLYYLLFLFVPPPVRT